MRTTSLRCIIAATAYAAFNYAIACGSHSSNDGGDSIPVGPGGSQPAPAASNPNPTPAPDAGAPEEQGLDGPPQVQFIGRFETTDPAGPKASWPGARIITRWVGTGISVKMSEFADDFMMDAAPSYWDYSIDDGTPVVLPMIADNVPHDFELASNLPKGPHKIELFKRSEMQTGITQFLGFDLKGGKTLTPPPRAKLHFEAMTDSYGTGYGIEQQNAPNLECLPVNHAGKWQNFRRAWPSLLAAKFGAEIEGSVYSGKGLTRGIWPTDDDGLIDYYFRSNPNPAMAHSDPQPFDLKSWQPDAFFLVQGTVDNGLSDFRDVYRDFVVNQLRARAPNAHIFLVVPGRVAYDQWVSVVNSVSAELNAKGDLKVYPVIPGVEQDEEMTSCGFHGNDEYHHRIASEIGAVVSAKTGW
jgi:hypothetical protein